MSDDLAAFLSRWKPLHNNAYWISNVLIVTVVTYLTLVMGELVPKRLGMMAADKIARAMSGLMKLLRQITYPFVWLLTKSTRGIMMLFGLSDLKEAKVTEDEIKALIEEGSEEGEIRQVEQELVERFQPGRLYHRFGNTHRSDLIWLTSTIP